MSPVLDETCLFCKIIQSQIPADIVAKTETTTVFKDIHPQAPIHYLIIPNTHTSCVSETQEAAILSDVLTSARDVALAKGLEDYRLVINNGAGAGQTVFHLHMHLLSGRALGWPPG
jgi:histidine triad (HIT) family protein